MGEQNGTARNGSERNSSERAIKPDDAFFRAAIEGGPYLVIAGSEVRGFPTYSAAEAFAKSLASVHTANVAVARVIFGADGRPRRLKTFATPIADSSFERARREFGL